ncbi:MAG: phenylalanine--tRNA ligase subunit alpha [Actinobacteria bacterium]|uniref:Phenylalanine--tRNA ligase alpha subunit n=1 Tax=freshwater metagenome TaxID=449393 RepID=A0A6J6A291_9ZZZZ|nr:phenylalanine--tRNA ligase subunit alpha [Actinomycetota bacterium]
MIERVSEIEKQAAAEISAASSSSELEALRVQYLGRKAELPQLLRDVSQLPPEQRGEAGKAANQARQGLEALLEARAALFEVEEMTASLAEDSVDVTLPGSPAESRGHHHLLSATRREIEDVFCGLGYSVVEGPEVESVHYNFDALNHDPAHPARGRSDTFYVEGGGEGADQILLRTHTSPMQVRIMEQTPPPIALIVPGRVFRRDSDATHTPQFHQIEGLLVDEGVTLADLKGTLLAFARAIFGEERELRLRPHFFPFTEPSVEVDVSCFMCSGGALPGGDRCSLCKGTGWLEVLGSGMVDPNVFAAVSEHGYDPDTHQGFAFGLGIERIAMLKHGVPDLRFFYENDLRFLRQFG